MICSLRMQARFVLLRVCYEVDKRSPFGNPEQRDFHVPERRRRSDRRFRGESEEDRNSQILLDELNMRRQKQLALLTRKASLLRTQGERKPAHFDIPGAGADSKDPRAFHPPDAFRDNSPLLHRSETILRSYGGAAPAIPHPSSPPAHASPFVLSYEVLETRATSVVLTVNSTASATVWCCAQSPSEPVDATALRMDHRGRNVQSGRCGGLTRRRRRVLPRRGTGA